MRLDNENEVYNHMGVRSIFKSILRAFFPNLFSIHKSLWNNVDLKQKRSMERIFFFERGIVSYINGSKLLTFKYLFFTQRRAVTRPPQIISVAI